MKKFNEINDQPKVGCSTPARGLIPRKHRDSRRLLREMWAEKKLHYPFLSEPVETHFLSTPASRSIDTTPTKGEEKIFIAPVIPATPQAIHAISREAVRHHFAQLTERLSDSTFDTEDRIKYLKSELLEFQQELRTKDLSRSLSWAQTASDRIGEQSIGSMDTGAARQFATTLKAVWKVELTSLEEFEDPLSVGSELLERFDIVSKAGRLPPFVSISYAVDNAKRGKSPEMCRKLDATGNLLIDFFGDASLELVPRSICEFNRFLHRLPRDHGQKHGKNRYKTEGEAPSKRNLIAAADIHDAQCYAAVRATSRASERQQLALLPDMLTVRMTQTNLERHLDRVHEILRAAAKHLGYVGDTKVMTYSDLSQEMKNCQRRSKIRPLWRSKSRPVWGERLGACGPHIASPVQGALAVRPIL